MRGRSLLLGTVVAVIMALASPVAAAGPTVVKGTGEVPTDLEAVQAAVDASSQVILEGTFDFGEGTGPPCRDGGGTLIIDSPTTLRGRNALILRGGYSDPPNEAFCPTILAEAPAARVTIRDLNMKESKDIAIQTVGVEANITNNHIASPDFGGILVVGSAGSQVLNNTVTDAAVGVLVEHSESVDVRNNTVAASDIGLLLAGVSNSTYANNSVLIGGDPIGITGGAGTTGVLLGSARFFGAPTTDNSLSNTTLEGEMTYGYLVLDEAAGNSIFIAPRNLDDATFVPPPNNEGVCENSEGKTVLFADSFKDENGDVLSGPATGNTVTNRARSATFIDCGDADNVVR